MQVHIKLIGMNKDGINLVVACMYCTYCVLSVKYTIANDLRKLVRRDYVLQKRNACQIMCVKNTQDCRELYTHQ